MAGVLPPTATTDLRPKWSREVSEAVRLITWLSAWLTPWSALAESIEISSMTMTSREYSHAQCGECFSPSMRDLTKPPRLPSLNAWCTVCLPRHD